MKENFLFLLTPMLLYEAEQELEQKDFSGLYISLRVRLKDVLHCKHINSIVWVIDLYLLAHRIEQNLWCRCLDNFC